MKKIFFIINIFLMLVLAICITFCLIFEIVALKWISGLILLLMSGLNLYYTYMKNPKHMLPAILITAANVFAFAGDMILYNGSIFSLIVFAISNVFILINLNKKSKICILDLIFAAAILIPMLLLIIFGDIYGFGHPFTMILIIFYFALLSLNLGKSLLDVFKNKNKANVLTVISLAILLVYNFLIICTNHSTISHYVANVYSPLFYIAYSLITLSIIFIKDNENKKEALKEGLNKHKSLLASLFMIMLVVGYSTAISFEAFNIANPIISKKEFLKLTNNDINIPIVEINTENAVAPKSKTEYVNASFKISNCENEEFNFSIDMKKSLDEEGSVGLRLRGNTTMRRKKKPYRIKFDEKQSLFGLKSNKSWVLLADYLDQSHMRNYTAFSLASYFDNLDFTPTPHHVALILNGNFQGLYTLCEQIDEKKGRASVEEDFDLSVDKEFPFLVEMDANAHLEGITGVDNFNVIDFPPVEIKYPEADERGLLNEEDVVFNYINEYINSSFTALRTNELVSVSFRPDQLSFEDLVDIDSAVDYYLVNEIMHNNDSTSKSIYLHKEKEGKMKFGPVWDFDFSMAGEWNLPYSKSYIEASNNLYIAKYSSIFNKLIRNEEFYNKVSQRFNELKHNILNIVDDLYNYKNIIDDIAVIDTKLWHGTNGEFEFDMQYDYLRLFLIERYKFLDKVFNLNYSEFINYL